MRAFIKTGEKKTETINFLILPEEIILYVTSLLSFSNLMTLQQLNRRFYSISSELGKLLIKAAINRSQLLQIKQVVLSTFSTVVLRTDGRIIFWGRSLNKTQPATFTSPSFLPHKAQNGITINAKTIGMSIETYNHAYRDEYTLYAHANNNLYTYNDAANPARLVDKHVSAFFSSNTRYVKKSKEGYVASGNNNCGELGVDIRDANHCTHIMPSVSKSIIIQAIACGRGHSLFLSRSGTVHSCGLNISGQCGLGNLGYELITVPQHITGLINIKGIAAGNYVSAAIDQDNALYTWGSNGKGMLGHGIIADDYKVPVPTVIHTITAKHIAIAATGTVGAINSKNRVFTWGPNHQGLLGNPSIGTSYEPTVVPALANIPCTRIDAGAHTMSVVTQSGELYMWGDNGSKQIKGSSSTIIYTPEKISLYPESFSRFIERLKSKQAASEVIDQVLNAVHVTTQKNEAAQPKTLSL
jgi:hypothetical protein